MAVTTETNRTAELVTDGVETDFDFGMLIHAESEVQVWYKVADGAYIQLVLNTDYGVVFTESGGTISTDGYTAPLAAGTLLIIRHLELTMQTNWLYNDNHSEQQHQDDFDRSVMRDIQMQEQLDRAVGFAIHSSTSGMEFPEPASEQMIGWNTAGTALENKTPESALTVSDYGKTLIDDANAATARTTLGLGTIATFAGDQDLQASDSPSFSELTITAPTQNYKWLADADNANAIALQSQTDDTPAGLHFFTKKGDGGDNIFFRLWRVGTAQDNDNYERLNIIGVGGENRFSILSQAGGTGTLCSLTLGMSTTHLVLNADDTSNFGGNLGVTGTITPTGQVLADVSGGAANPGLSFAGHINTGLYVAGTGQERLYGATAGSSRFKLSATVFELSVPLLVLDPAIIDTTSTEAFLVRKTGDGGDVFSVNTTTPRVNLSGHLYITDASKGYAIKEYDDTGTKFCLKRGTAGNVNDDSVIALCNRQASGEVAIMANNAAGAAGEVEAARFAYDAITLKKTTSFSEAVIYTSTATISSSSDAFDVSGKSIIYIDTSGGNVVIGGFANGVTGQLLRAIIIDHTNNTTFEHNEATGTQKFMMHDSSDETLDDFGGWVFIFYGTYWYDISHAKHV